LSIDAILHASCQPPWEPPNRHEANEAGLASLAAHYLIVFMLKAHGCPATIRPPGPSLGRKRRHGTAADIARSAIGVCDQTETGASPDNGSAAPVLGSTGDGNNFDFARRPNPVAAMTVLLARLYAFRPDYRLLRNRTFVPCINAPAEDLEVHVGAFERSTARSSRCRCASRRATCQRVHDETAAGEGLNALTFRATHSSAGPRTHPMGVPCFYGIHKNRELR
jgi:hypothetical protein